MSIKTTEVIEDGFTFKRIDFIYKDERIAIMFDAITKKIYVKNMTLKDGETHTVNINE